MYYEKPEVTSLEGDRVMEGLGLAFASGFTAPLPGGSDELQSAMTGQTRPPKLSR